MKEDGIAVLIAGILVIAIYFLPTVVALCRGKATGVGAVFLVNLLLGVTGVGWALALLWSFSGKTNADLALEERRHQELLEAARGTKMK